MKKKLICLALAIVFVISLTSCFKGDIKYNYKNMSKYITLVDYESFIAEIDMDTIQATIDSYIVEAAKDYTLKEGDVVTIKLKEVCYVIWDKSTDSTGKEIDVDSKGDKIEELNKEFTIQLGRKLFSEKFEETMIGSKLGETFKGKMILSDDFEIEEYRGKEIYYESEITGLDYIVKRGDIVDVEYKGYHIELDDEGNPKLDEDGNYIIKQVEDKDNEGEMIDKIFNEGDMQSFIGSNMAIEDFEKGLEGMKFGETKKFPATFPEDYDREDEDGNSLNGKTVIFECTIKNLYVTPIYNDEFVKENIKSYETVEEFEKELIDTAIRNEISKNLMENSVIHSYPKSEYKVAKTQLENDLKNLQPYGISYEQYLLWFMGMTPNEYLEYTLNMELTYYAVANKEGIAPSKDAVKKAREDFKESYIQNYMSQGFSRKQAESYTSIYMENQVSPYMFYDELLFSMVDDYLFEITESKINPRTKTSVSQEMAEKDKQEKEEQEKNESTENN